MISRAFAVVFSWMSYSRIKPKTLYIALRESQQWPSFLCGVQLVPRSSVLTILDLKVDVRLKNAEIFRSVLSGKDDGSTGGWRCC